MDTLERHFRQPRNKIEQQIARLGPWFHNIHLPGRIQTAPDHPLGDFPRFKWNKIKRFLGDLNGKTVLDIGCNGGFYCFEMAKQGATVLGIDSNQRYLRQGRWVRKVFGFSGSQVKFRQMNVYDVARLGRKFDIVLFLGVFYHLRYPLLALDIVSVAAKNLLVFQTMTLPGPAGGKVVEDVDINSRKLLTKPSWPRMAFIEHKLQADATNWWAPNRPGVEAMLRSAGFVDIRYIGTEIWICRNAGKAQDSDLPAVLG